MISFPTFKAKILFFSAGQNFLKTLPLVAALSIVGLTKLAQAGEVQQMKGTKVLITLTDLEANVGTQLFIVNSENKKIGLIEVKQVKNGKAVAEILKGRGEIGASVQAKSAPAANADSAPSERTEKYGTTTGRKKIAIGVLGGLASSTFAMDVGPITATTACPTATCRTPANLTGTSFNLKAFGDYDLSKSLTLRAAAGLETISATGSVASALCANDSTTCTVSINYLALEGSGHYNYLTGKTRAWVGLGYSFLIGMSTTTTIPNLSTSGGTNQMILVSTGADFAFKKGFIPVAFDYGIFPGSSDVKASAMFLRAGYGWNY